LNTKVNLNNLYQPPGEEERKEIDRGLDEIMNMDSNRGYSQRMLIIKQDCTMQKIFNLTHRQIQAPSITKKVKNPQEEKIPK